MLRPALRKSTVYFVRRAKGATEWTSARGHDDEIVVLPQQVKRWRRKLIDTAGHIMNEVRDLEQVGQKFSDFDFAWSGDEIIRFHLSASMIRHKRCINAAEHDGRVWIKRATQLHHSLRPHVPVRHN